LGESWVDPRFDNSRKSDRIRVGMRLSIACTVVVELDEGSPINGGQLAARPFHNDVWN
jgi:hypothetical protein